MSTRELCMQLLNHVPEYKIGYVLAYLQGLTVEEEADDAYCERMAQDYLSDPERGDVVSLEDCKREWGLV